MALDQLISLYSKRDLDFRANLQPGQVCWTPVCYSNENAEIWRPTQFDYSETQATHFQLVAKPSKAYQEARVIHSPTLEAYEEFPVIRAKQRPVIILALDPAPISHRPDRMKLDKHLCLVAPYYSTVDALGISKIQEPILDRIRSLEFPQFLFLAQSPAMANDSLLRLDSIFHTYRAHLEPTQWGLSSDAWNIVQGQLEYIFNGVFGGSFKAARDALQGK